MRPSFLASCSAFLLVVACGSSFQTGGGDAGGSGNPADAAGAGSDGATDSAGGGTEASPASDGASQDALSVEGGTGEASIGLSVHCGPMTCSGTTTVCCVASPFACAHLQCGCEVQLECASNADCPAGGTCCMGPMKDATCTNGHPVARCAALGCQGGDQQLCDPQSPSCNNGQCSNDSGDLQNVGLPSNQGYGVCK